MFDKRTHEDNLQIQAYVTTSTITNMNLLIFKDKYRILDEFELLRPSPKDGACFPPSGYYSAYEEHLKSEIFFSPHPLVVEVLRFWNF